MANLIANPDWSGGLHDYNVFIGPEVVTIDGAVLDAGLSTAKCVTASANQGFTRTSDDFADALPGVVAAKSYDFSSRMGHAAGVQVEMWIRWYKDYTTNMGDTNHYLVTLGAAFATYTLANQIAPAGANQAYLYTTAPGGAATWWTGFQSFDVSPIVIPSAVRHPAYFSAANFWNSLIPAGATIDANSAAMVANLVTDGAAHDFPINYGAYGVSLYFANARTPRKTVTIAASWRPSGFNNLTNVPIPSGATSAPGSDHHMCIVDQAAGCMYDFIGAVKDGSGNWSCSWGNTIRLDGSGVFPQGLSSRGSGFALMAGAITAADMAQSEIRHKIAISTTYTRSAGPVLPATESDGAHGGTAYIPEGAQGRLKLATDISGATAWQQKIGRAFKRYGWVCVDSGGIGVFCQSENSISQAQQMPWGTVAQLGTNYPLLPLGWLAQMEVLTVGAQYSPSIYPVSSGCGAYTA